MTHTIRQTLIAATLALLTACGDATVALNPLPAGATVLAFGDSLTAGNGAGQAASYPAVLAQQAQLTVINAGVSGEVSADGLARLPDLLARHQPRLVILCHGGNDLLRKHPDSATRANLLAMIETIQASGAQVLLLGVPRPGLFLSPAELYAEVAQQTGVAYLADAVADVLSEPGLKSDAVHPNAQGYRLMAAAVQDYLFAAGAL